MIDASNKDQIFITKLTEIILANLGDENFGAKELSHESGISQDLLSQRLYAITRKTINRFILETRLHKAWEMLQNEKVTASVVAYKVGFSNPDYFDICFYEFFGYPPGKIKKPIPGLGEEVNFISAKEKIEQKRPVRRTFIISASGIMFLAVIFYLVYAVFLKNSSSGIRANVKHLAKSIIRKPADDNTVKDIDGNIYHIVTIGKQVWMAEDLKTTKYNDGTTIPYVADDMEWAKLNTPAYCYPGNDSNNKDVYGLLYNWYTLGNGKLCPPGWHISTDNEWETLMDYCGGWEIAGGKLKEAGTSHWEAPNIGATNDFGFTALPCGGRRADGVFYAFGHYVGWWSPPRYGDFRSLASDRTWVYCTKCNATQGFSIRCIKD